MTERRWSQNIHLVRGGLHGYCAHCPTRSRHAALLRTVRANGYDEAIHRLVVIDNLNVHRPALHRVMSTDVRWLEKYGRDAEIRRE